MSRLPNDDLFEGSKMTFGEHLEELRVALFRSLIGLAVGVIVGFMISGQVIQWVEKPLVEALNQYYLTKSKTTLTNEYGSLPDQLTDVLEDENRVHEDVFIEREELARLLKVVMADTKSMPFAPESVTPEAASPKAASPKAATSKTVLAETKGEEALAVKGAGEANKPDSNESPAQNSVDGNQEQTTTTPSPNFSTASKPGPPSSNFIQTRIWRDSAYTVQSTNAQEPFFSWMKVGVISGVTIAAPWIFFQLWVFVAEGLYPNEKHYVYIYLPFSLALFLAGAALAFFYVFEPVLGFLFSFNAMMNSDPVPRISEWLSFFLLLPLGFGVGFQLPLVMLFLNRIGVVSVDVYLNQWRVAILIIFVAAMLLTPADPWSMLLLAVPLTILYFLGVVLCQYMPKRESPFGEGYDPK